MKNAKSAYVIKSDDGHFYSHGRWIRSADTAQKFRRESAAFQLIERKNILNATALPADLLF